MPQHVANRSRRTTLLTWLVTIAIVPALVLAVRTVTRLTGDTASITLDSSGPGRPGVTPEAGQPAGTSSRVVVSLGTGTLSTPPTTASPTTASTGPAPTTTPHPGPDGSADRGSARATRPGSSRSVGATPSRTASAKPGSSAPAGSGRAADVLTLTNQRRAAAGCPALWVDPRLARAAQDHAADMVARHYFDHVTPDGREPGDRAEAAGFTEPVGENIAVGYSSAAEVMAGWMASSGHRANILNCSYTAIGIGYDAGVVKQTWGPGSWVQVFGIA